jgi:hypothetical protein
LYAEAKKRSDIELNGMIKDRVEEARRHRISQQHAVRSDGVALDKFLFDSENRKRYLNDPEVKAQFRVTTAFDEASERILAEARCQSEFESQWGSHGSIPLGEIGMLYRSRDEWAREYKGSLDRGMGGNIRRSSISVSNSGFTHHEHFAALLASEPDTIYTCIIDVDRGRHSKEYAISRVVASGDAEHFQIIVGATKSAHTKLKFKFYADKSTVVEFKPFLLELWNPKNARFERVYKDGDAVRSLSAVAKDKSKDNLSWDESAAMRNKSKLDAFPSSELAGPYMQDGRLKQILPEWRSEDVTIHLVFRAGHGLRPAVRVFVDHLVRDMRMLAVP